MIFAHLWEGPSEILTQFKPSSKEGPRRRHDELYYRSVDLWVKIQNWRLKLTQTERGNARGGQNKMAAVFTHFLIQKSTHLSTTEMANWPTNLREGYNSRNLRQTFMRRSPASKQSMTKHEKLPASRRWIGCKASLILILPRGWTKGRLNIATSGQNSRPAAAVGGIFTQR